MGVPFQLRQFETATDRGTMRPTHILSAVLLLATCVVLGDHAPARACRPHRG